MTPSPTAVRRNLDHQGAPTGWKPIRLGSVFDHVVDTGHDIDLPVLAVTIAGGVVRRDSLDRRMNREVERETYLRVQPGDIAYNTMRMWQGASGLAMEEGYVSPAYIVARPAATECAKFWWQYFKAPATIKRFFDHSQGVAKDRYRLYFHHFATVPALRPPLPEQKQIAAILSSVDEAIHATRAVVEQTQRVKEGLLQDLLTRGIGHTRFKQTEIGEIPESWETVSLGQVLTDIVGGKSPTTPDQPANGKQWGVLKVSAIGRGTFLSEQNKVLPSEYHVAEAHRVVSGDILITRANTAALVGACCQVPAGDYRLMLSDKTLRLVANPDRIKPGYLTHVVEQPTARRYFANVATGSSASMKNLSQAKIRAMRVALPPLKEQGAIAQRLNDVECEVEAHIAISRTLEATKAGLLQDLLTGKVRVSV